MIVKSRLKLGSKLTTGNLLSVCRPQIRLYTEKLLGCQNGAEADISKLKTMLQVLFPVKFQNQSLEFKDIEIAKAGGTAAEAATGGEDSGGEAAAVEDAGDAGEAEYAAEAGGAAAEASGEDDDGGGELDDGSSEADGAATAGRFRSAAAAAVSGFKASVKLEWFRYGKIFGILYVQQRKSIMVPLVRFPKLSDSDTLRVNEIEKVLVSQLGRQPGIRIEADENSIDIRFLKKDATMFRIKADRETCSALCEGREVELLQALMALGVTSSHILKVLHDVKTVVFTNGE